MSLWKIRLQISRKLTAQKNEPNFGILTRKMINNTERGVCVYVSVFTANMFAANNIKSRARAKYAIRTR